MKIVSKTHIGLVRKNNEDSMLVREPVLFAIADGMGGYAAGEVASKEALTELDALAKDFPGYSDEKLIFKIGAAIKKINGKIYHLAKEKENYGGMGTTLTGIYLENNKGYIFNVGDSRVYILHNKELKQITIDHSFVAELLAKGEITKKEAFNHPKKNVLLKGVGVETHVEGDIFAIELENDDKILICSDGLTDMVSDIEIEEILNNNDLETGSNLLLETSLMHGGKDNVSFIIVQVEDIKGVN